MASQRLITIDSFSDLLWGLCLAESLHALADSHNEDPRLFASTFVLCLLIAITIFRNYYANRMVLMRFGPVIEDNERNSRYGQGFNWLLSSYIASFFLLVGFHSRPLFSALSASLIGAIGVVVTRTDLSILTRLRNDENCSLSRTLVEDLHDLSGFWLRFDLAFALYGGMLAALAWTLRWNAKSWHPSAALGVLLLFFNALDLIRNRPFYFGPLSSTPKAPDAAPNEAASAPPIPPNVSDEAPRATEQHPDSAADGGQAGGAEDAGLQP